METLDKETAKSPARRKFERNSWWIVSLLVIAGFLGAKWYWLIDVTRPLESTEGLIQRAAVFQKAFDYDDNMGRRMRKNGWAKQIIYWPIKPTDDEIKYAGDFMQYAMSAYLFLKKEKLVCGAYYTFDLENKDISDGELSLLKEAADFAASANIADYENSAELGIAAIKFKFPC